MARPLNYHNTGGGPLMVLQKKQGVGILDCRGHDVPPDGTDGFASVCKFSRSVSPSPGNTVFFNEGTVESCDFNAVGSGSS